MTKPRPFPWGEELRYTLTNYRQGGNWWKATGRLRLFPDDEPEESRQRWPFAIGFGIETDLNFIAIKETKDPRTREKVFEGVACFFNNIRELTSPRKTRTAEVKRAIALLFRDNGQLPTPGELRKYLLATTKDTYFFNDLKSEIGISLMRDALGHNSALWQVLPRNKDKGKGALIKPPKGWKNRIIDALSRSIARDCRGRFILELETVEQYTLPPKRPRGRPRKE